MIIKKFLDSFHLSCGKPNWYEIRALSKPPEHTTVEIKANLRSQRVFIKSSSIPDSDVDAAAARFRKYAYGTGEPRIPDVLGACERLCLAGDWSDIYNLWGQIKKQRFTFATDKHGNTTGIKIDHNFIRWEQDGPMRSKGVERWEKVSLMDVLEGYLHEDLLHAEQRETRSPELQEIRKRVASIPEELRFNMRNAAISGIILCVILLHQRINLGSSEAKMQCKVCNCREMEILRKIHGGSATPLP